MTLFTQTFHVQEGSSPKLRLNVKKNIFVPVTPIYANPRAVFTRGSSATKLDWSTVSGDSPRFETGRNGKSICVEEGTTNLLGTSGTLDIDSNSDGIADNWRVVSRAGSTWQISLQPGLSGNAQHYFPTLDVAWGQYLATDPATIPLNLTSGSTYTVSFWARADVPGPWTVCLANDAGTVFYLNSIGFSPTGSWQKFSFTFTSSATGTDGAIRFQTQSNAVNIDLYVDNVQLEQKDHSTSFTTGTRNSEVMTVDRISDMKVGTIEMVFSPLDTPLSFGKLLELGQFSSPLTIDDLSIIYGSSALNTVQLGISNTQTGSTLGISAAAPSNLIPGRWYYVAVTWSATQATITLYDYVNGAAYSATSATYARSPNWAGLRKILMGTSPLNEASNVLIDECRLSNNVFTATDIRNSYLTSGPLPVTSNTLMKMDFDNTLDVQTGISPSSSSGITGVFRSVVKSAQTIVSRAVATVSHVLSGDDVSGGLFRFKLTTASGGIYYLSDIERTFSVENVKFSRDQRSATAKMFRKAKANKRKFTLQWKWLPYLTANVLDKGSGGEDLLAIMTGTGTVTLYIPDDSSLSPGDVVECFVAMDGLKVDLEQYINGTMYWDVTLTLNEV